MQPNTIEHILIKLAACELSCEQWNDWWNTNDESLRNLLSEKDYLQLKPEQHSFKWVPILGSQKAAVKYLTERNILFKASALYKENYEKERQEYYTSEQLKKASQLLELKAQCPKLFAKYPRFSESLQSAFGFGNRIESGIPEAGVNSLPYRLPMDISEFFTVVSVIYLDGISIDYSNIYTKTILGKEYLVLGKFFKHAIDDLLLVDINSSEACSTIYFFNSANGVTKLCDSIYDLMESTFSYYNHVNNR